MRTLLVFTAVFGFLALAAAPPAEAGERCRYRGGFRGGVLGYDRCGSGYRTWDYDYGCSGAAWRRYARGRYHACRHHARFVSRGQSWILMRRYLYRLEISPRHVHPSRYFFDRWPCALADAPQRPFFGGLRCPGEDFPHTECPISQVALGIEVEDGPTLDVSTLDTESRLVLGMERFYRGAFDDAAADFEAVALSHPNDPRARTGLLMTALMRSDRDRAGDELRRLYELGEVSGADRLALDKSFLEPARFLIVRDGLSSYVEYHFHRVEPLVVTAWAHAVTGETRKARGQLRAALRFDPDHPVARHLLETLDEPARAPRTEGDTPTPDVMAVR